MSQSFITPQTPAGDFEVLTVSTTALPLTAAKMLIHQEGGFHKRVVRVFFTVETQSVTIRFDGGTPTASVGHVIAAGDDVTIEGEQNCANLQFIRTSGSDSTVKITYFYNY